jgi:hypothetical protein
MSASHAVVWSVHGSTHSGALTLANGRLVLSGREHTLAVPLGSISAVAIARGPGARLRGLPSLAVRLPDGDLLHIASLAGAGSLHELLESIESAQPPVGSGT